MCIYKLTTRFCLILSLTLLNSPAYTKGIYKCVKANGEVEYTQKASKDCNAQIIKKQGGKVDRQAVEKMHQDEKLYKINAEEKRQSDLEKEDEKRAQKEKDQYCTETKENLAQISNTSHVFEYNSQGERVKLSEEQRQQRIASKQKDIDTHCQ